MSLTFLQIRIAYEFTEDFVIKYLWSAAGYVLIAVPLLFTRTKRSMGIQTGDKDIPRRPDHGVADRTESEFSPIVSTVELNCSYLSFDSLHLQPPPTSLPR